MATTDSFDYVIVGGGTAGSVLAPRLKRGGPPLSILVIEAGPDASQHPLVLDGGKFSPLLGSEIDWNYRTVPQNNLGGRILSNYAGKALGGSTAINGAGKLKNPEKGLSIGSPAFNNPAFFKSLPIDFVVTQPVPLDGLRKALVKDDPDLDSDRHPLMSSQRGHVKVFTLFVANNPTDPVVNVDGTHIITRVVCLLPLLGVPLRWPIEIHTVPQLFILTISLRGRPVYEGLRKLREMLRDTPAGQEMIESETVEEGMLPLTPMSDDEQLNDPRRRLK
ncbi:hypothetical protein BBP40_000174 [Aspergillus hancockii]|nr:hypothetical protein BBP40_000174 [Aspergillus hancockii]